MRLFLAAALVAAAAGWGLTAPVEVAAQDYGGLPAGPDREAVYFNCSACHSIQLVAQQPRRLQVVSRVEKHLTSLR